MARFDVTTPSHEFAAALGTLPFHPMSNPKEHEQWAADVEGILEEFADATVGEVVARVSEYVAFLEVKGGNTGLVVTTIDHAKSEEFDTVLLLGPDHLTIQSKRRLFVALARARERVCLVVGGMSRRDRRRGQLITALPRDLYTSRDWPS